MLEDFAKRKQENTGAGPIVRTLTTWSMVSLVLKCRPLNPSNSRNSVFLQQEGFGFSKYPNTRSISSSSSPILTSQHLALRPLTKLQEQAAFTIAPYLTLEDPPDDSLQIYIDICSLQSQHCLEIYGAHTSAHAKGYTYIRKAVLVIQDALNCLPPVAKECLSVPGGYLTDGISLMATPSGRSI